MAYHREALTLYGAAQIGGSAVNTPPAFVINTLNGNPDFLLTKGSVDPNIRILNYRDPNSGKPREYYAMQYTRNDGAWHPWVIVHGASTMIADHILAWPVPPRLRERAEMVENLIQNLFKKLVDGLVEAVEPGVTEDGHNDDAEVASDNDERDPQEKSHSKTRSVRRKK